MGHDPNADALNKCEYCEASFPSKNKQLGTLLKRWLWLLFVWDPVIMITKWSRHWKKSREVVAFKDSLGLPVLVIKNIKTNLKAFNLVGQLLGCNIRESANMYKKDLRISTQFVVFFFLSCNSWYSFQDCFPQFQDWDVLSCFMGCWGFFNTFAIRHAQPVQLQMVWKSNAPPKEWRWFSVWIKPATGWSRCFKLWMSLEMPKKALCQAMRFRVCLELRGLQLSG